MVVFRVADAVGRRREMIFGAWLYILGAFLQFLAGCHPFDRSEVWGLACLVLGRMVYGVGCGFVMHGAPARGAARRLCSSRARSRRLERHRC